MEQSDKTITEPARTPEPPEGAHPLEYGAGWIICGCLVYAPFAFGSIAPFAIKQLQAAVGAASALWILDCLFTKRLPRVPAVPALCGIAVLASGWFMTWNAHYGYGMPFYHQKRPALPGAYEYVTSLLAMQRFTALFAVFLAAGDLCRHVDWRRRFTGVICWTGAAIAVFGVAQQLGFTTFVPSRMSQMEGSFFATFNYHGNAGAYLNLSLPLAAAAFMYSLRSTHPRYKLGSFCLLAAIVSGVIACPSRGAQAISAGIIVVVCVWTGSYLSRDAIHRAAKYMIVALIAIVVIGFLAVKSPRNAVRWRELPAEISRDSSRWQIWRVDWQLARTAGPLGRGPGSFKMLLPAMPGLSEKLTSRWVLQAHYPGTRISMWSMAHNDYLQMVIEFGWLSALAAGVILFGGVVTGIRRLSASSRADIEEGYYMHGVIVAMLGVCIHSMFDFPLQVACIQITVAVMLGMCWTKICAANRSGAFKCTE